MADKFYCGSAPTSCDICSHPITETFVDGKTNMGPWGNMCPSCHGSHGCGLGTGRGQKYQRQPDGRWLKVGG